MLRRSLSSSVHTLITLLKGSLNCDRGVHDSCWSCLAIGSQLGSTKMSYHFNDDGIRKGAGARENMGRGRCTESEENTAGDNKFLKRRKREKQRKTSQQRKRTEVP